jgi:ABC-type sugar transport system substrate-binding protein
MPTPRRIALFLSLPNETTQAWVSDAKKEARRYNLEVIEYWYENSTQKQTRQISECIFNDLADALIIMPARFSGPARLIAQAVSKNKPVVLLNRTAGDMNPDVAWSLPQLNLQYPSVLAACVTPDEIEIGRLQGRQIRALLPDGGTVLYVQGDTMTSAAMDRTTGMEEIIRGDARYRIGKVDGKWNAESAKTAVLDWLNVVRSDDTLRLDLVCSQSEMMIPGIQAALSSGANESVGSRLRQALLICCNGLPASKREVDKGILAATIEIPLRIPPAIRLVGEYWNMGKLPPEPELKLQPTSYPPLDALANRASRPPIGVTPGH